MLPTEKSKLILFCKLRKSEAFQFMIVLLERECGHNYSSDYIFNVSADTAKTLVSYTMQGDLNLA